MGTRVEIDRDYLLTTLRDMIRIESVLPHEARLAAYLAERIRAMGVEPEWHEVAPGRPNVYASAEAGPPGRFLIFSGHSDTVAAARGWESDPLEPHERDGRLYGLGAINMKAGLACMLAAFKALVASPSYRGRLGLAVTVDQEGHSLGSRAMLDTEWAKCDAMLHAEHFFGDSERDYLPLACTGKVLYRVTVKGRAAHAFRPHLGGINAVDDAARIVTALERLPLQEHELFGKGTVCTLKIDGGYRQYAIVVPERCEIIITRLTVPGETVASAVADLESLAASLALESTVEIEAVDPCYEPYFLDPDTPLLKHFRPIYEEVVGRPPVFAGHRGIVDANVFTAEGGIPTVVFGPRGANHHCPGEYVELGTLLPTAEVYARTALSYLADGHENET